MDIILYSEVETTREEYQVTVSDTESSFTFEFDVSFRNNAPSVTMSMIKTFSTTFETLDTISILPGDTISMFARDLAILQVIPFDTNDFVTKVQFVLENQDTVVNTVAQNQVIQIPILYPSQKGVVPHILILNDPETTSLFIFFVNYNCR